MSDLVDSRRHALKALEDLDSKRADLMSELKASLALESLWPEVFEHGSVVVRIGGSPANGFRLYIQRNSGEIRDFPISEISLDLAARPHIKTALKHIANGPKCADSKTANALLKELWKTGR